MIRSTSTELLDSLLNHPNIRPHIGDGGPLESTPDIFDRAVLLVGEQGGGLFVSSTPESYEAHWLFTKGGKAALALAKAMVSAMLYEHEAEMVWGQVPVQNRRCRIFTRLAGFTSLGFHERPDQTFELFVARR
jgi:hypothetical protein